MPPPSMEEVKKTMLRHAKMQLEYKGAYTGMREMRKHVAWYTSGMPAFCIGTQAGERGGNL